MKYEQEPPFAVQIELVEGCNLFCNFCGLQGIREKDHKNYKFAETRTIQRIFESLIAEQWNCRIEFAMHGEPTMHPNFFSLMTDVVPHRHFHTMVTSNGGGLLGKEHLIDGLFAAGLDILALDNYEYVKIVPKIIAAYNGKIPVRYYPADKDANPHQRGGRQRIVVIEDISKAVEGTHSKLNNHAGAAFEKKVVMKPCAKPFRELSFRWDGSVAICCNDWRGEYVIGNIHKMSIEDIWQHPRFQAARKKLYRGQRDFGPCAGCDALSYRTGLLPDKKGQSTLQPSNAEDEIVISAALAEGPLTNPVRRYYEIGGVM